MEYLELSPLLMILGVCRVAPLAIITWFLTRSSTSLLSILVLTIFAGLVVTTFDTLHVNLDPEEPASSLTLLCLMEVVRGVPLGIAICLPFVAIHFFGTWVGLGKSSPIPSLYVLAALVVFSQGGGITLALRALTSLHHPQGSISQSPLDMVNLITETIATFGKALILSVSLALPILGVRFATLFAWSWFWRDANAPQTGALNVLLAPLMIIFWSLGLLTICNNFNSVALQMLP